MVSGRGTHTETRFEQGPSGETRAHQALFGVGSLRGYCMDQLVRHPVFGYQISYRRVLDVQARLLGRHLSGEIPYYPEFLTR